MKDERKFSIVENIRSTKVRAEVDAMKDAKNYKERAQLSAQLYVEGGTFEEHLRPIAKENERQVNLLSDLMGALYERMPDMSVVVSTLYMSLIDILASNEEDSDCVRIAAMSRELREHLEKKQEWLLDVVEADILMCAIDSIRKEVQDASG